MFIAKGNNNEEEVIIESTDGIDWEVVENAETDE